MLPINSSTTPDELERMLFVVNPDCAALIGEGIDQAAEIERLEQELADAKAMLEPDKAELVKQLKQAERRAHASYEKLQAERTAMRDLINAVLTTPRVPKALKASAKRALHKQR